MADHLNESEVYKLAQKATNWSASALGGRFYGYLNQGFDGPQIVMDAYHFNPFNIKKPTLVSIAVESGTGDAEVVIGKIKNSRNPEYIQFFQQVAEGYKKDTKRRKEQAEKTSLKKARALLLT